MITCIIKTRLGGFLVSFHSKKPFEGEREILFPDKEHFIEWITEYFEENDIWK